MLRPRPFRLVLPSWAAWGPGKAGQGAAPLCLCTPRRPSVFQAGFTEWEEKSPTPARTDVVGESVCRAGSCYVPMGGAHGPRGGHCTGHRACAHLAPAPAVHRNHDGPSLPSCFIVSLFLSFYVVRKTAQRRAWCLQWTAAYVVFAVATVCL